MATPERKTASVLRPLYLELAAMLERQIHERTLRVGERLPSVRRLAARRRVSVTTVLQAFAWLEQRGLIQARPRSGYYVRARLGEGVPEPEPRRPRGGPRTVELTAVVQDLLRASHDADLVPLGGAAVAPALLPAAHLNRIIRQVLRRFPQHSAHYEFAPGAEGLRRQIARRWVERGCALPADEITVTCGATEALNLCLRAVARPGDVVAVESPSYHGLLQVIESLGLRAIEIPTHPREGIELEALERQLASRHIAACLVMPCGHNPLGFSQSEERTRALVELTARHGVALVEDDVYGDLHHEGERPRLAKAFDRAGLVLTCSSFSKLLGPGYRVGWVHAGRYAARVDALKSMSTLATPTLSQLAIAEFLGTGHYERHLRRLRASARDSVAGVSDAVRRWFPPGTRLSRPRAGFLLWVQLPGGRDGLDLYRAALERGISVMPGAVFSPSGAFRDCVRLNCGHPWSPQLDRALRALGELLG